MGGHFHTNRGGTLLWALLKIVGGFKGVQSAQPVLASVVTASRKGLFHTNRGKATFDTDVIAQPAAVDPALLTPFYAPCMPDISPLSPVSP